MRTQRQSSTALPRSKLLTWIATSTLVVVFTALFVNVQREQAFDVAIMVAPEGSGTADPPALPQPDHEEEDEHDEEEEAEEKRVPVAKKEEVEEDEEEEAEEKRLQVAQKEVEVEVEVELTNSTAGGATKPRRTAGPCAFTKELSQYTLNRIRSAKVTSKPYPHVYISEIFEPSFYADCIMPNMPSNETSHTKKLYKNPDGRGVGRYTLKLRGTMGPFLPQDVKRLAPAMRRRLNVNFWDSFSRMFGSRQLIQAWTDKFKATLSRRRKTTTRQPKFYYFMELNRDISGYAIGPHTDSDSKWVTTLYYLPKTADHPEGGTAVVRSKSGKKQTSGSKREGPNNPDFVVDRVAPFVPNSVMAFAPCHTSWHAVPAVKQAFARDTIQGFISSGQEVKKQRC